MNLLDAVNICLKPGEYTRAEVLKAAPILVEHLEVKEEDYRHVMRKLETCEAVLKERDEAQHIASLVLDVEGWLFRTVDALTDDDTVASERTQSALLDVYNDMVNARENRRKGSCPGPGKCQDPGCPAHYAHGD